MLIIVIAGCQNQPQQIFITVDGERQSLTTEADTVRAALDEAGITLESLDRVEPDLYVSLAAGMDIVVTRVTQEVETVREIIPFERQTITNEALAPGETRIAQLGVNGEDEVSMRVTYEDGEVVSRIEIGRRTITAPVSEILVVPPQGSIASVPLDGTVAYIANGNAWMMRGSSGSRRALTSEGNLDGRVFALSPDGRQLLYTSELTGDIEAPLNELWLVSTVIVGEAPARLGVQGVLQAVWSPVVSESVVAYTTAERTPNAPGWRANNDLWLLDTAATTSRRLVAANTQGLYPWWGTTFTWSPDGSQLAYARADQIGVVSRAGEVTPLVDFVPFQTFSEWVWVPGVSWSPEGEFIATTVHGPPVASEPAEESQRFDLLLLKADGAFSVTVAEEVGMWANPSWGEAGVVYGEAVTPFESVNSRYSIQLIDRDGSNRRQLFPFQSEPGIRLPELVWSPGGDNLLFVYNGNLYTVNTQGTPPRQLTQDGQVSHPQWTESLVATVMTNTITATVTATPTRILTTTPSLTPTARSTATPTPTITTDEPE